MDNDEQDHGPNHPDRMPALLAAFDPIRQDHVQGIIPNPLRRLEMDAMLGKVGSGLCFIPFKPHASLLEY